MLASELTLVFQTRKNFTEDYTQFGHAPSKIFADPVLGLKSLQNVCLKGPKLLAAPVGRPLLSGRPWKEHGKFKYTRSEALNFQV
jgi:hypothetical protein